jgi:hypothetical protein
MTNEPCINWPCAKGAGHAGPCGTSRDEQPVQPSSNVLLARADALCSAAVSYAGDTGLHSEAWLWDKIREYQAARDSSSHEPFHSLASEPSAANSGQCESRKTAQSGTGAGLSLPPEVGPMCIICGESFSRHSIKYELVNMFAPNAVKFACPAVTKEGEV